VPQEVRAVVALAKGEPVSVQTILVPDPGPHEVGARETGTVL
jgi:S-(hydroxymethyl)mycothiol dehydrogenase